MIFLWNQSIESLTTTGEIPCWKPIIIDIIFSKMLICPIPWFGKLGIDTVADRERLKRWLIVIFIKCKSRRYESFSNISVGGFYLPKINSISSYFNRITYRAGFHYQKTGLVVNETSIDQYGISFGLSLPIGLKLSNVNLGFEAGKRGTTDNNLIEENFYNFRLSLSLNDKWFRKQKIY